jgi:hypothetical protein
MLFVVKIFSINLLYSQNYIEYSRIKWQAVDCIIEEKFQEAQIYLDSLYNNYDLIFAGDCQYALKVAILNNDSVRAKKFLLKGLSAGIPIEYVKKDKFINKNLKFDLWKEISQKDIDSLQDIYKKRVNWELLEKIETMFVIDQKVTEQINKSSIYFFKWRKVMKNYAKTLKNMINEYGYPGEKIVGLGNKINEIKSIESYETYLYFLRADETFYILIHYFAYYERDWDEYFQILYNQLENGNLTPYQFGTFCDYRAKWKKSKKKGTDYIYYIHDHPVLSEQKIEETNKRREDIGLLDVEFEKKKRAYNFNIQKNNLYDSKIRLESVL